MSKPRLWKQGARLRSHHWRLVLLGLELRSSESRAQGSPWRSSGLRVPQDEALFWAVTEITLATFLDLVSSSWIMMARPSSNLRRLNQTRYENIRRGVCTCACLSSKLSCNLQQAPYDIYSSDRGTKWEVVSAVTGHRRPHSLMVKKAWHFA